MTPAFRTFVAPARARPAIWRLVLGTVLALAVYLATAFGIVALAWRLIASDTDPWLWFGRVAEAGTPATALTVLATFLGMAIAPMVAVGLLHRRSPATLFGPPPRVLRDFVVAAATVALLLAVSVAGWALFYDADPGLPPGLWLALLPLALLGVLLQTGAEELLFRGYLQQQLAARFASPLAWAVLPSLLFAAGHHDPAAAGGNVWLVVATTGLFGLLAADLTARSGSIGAAWGFHFANNCYAILLIATEGTLTGLALYRTPYGVGDMDIPLVLPADAAIMVAGWWLVRRQVSAR